jgi:hypothetical protein
MPARGTTRRRRSSSTDLERDTMVRPLLSLAFALGLAACLPAQANDYTGLRIFSGIGTVGAPARLTCGTPFDCTPFTATFNQGDNVSAVLLGNLNGAYLILASADTTGFCLPLNIPGVVNDLTLHPGRLLVLSVGVCSLSDGGRCNGGSSGTVPLFQIPLGLTGAVAFQALAEAPLSVGGNGFALSKGVVISF